MRRSSSIHARSRASDMPSASSAAGASAPDEARRGHGGVNFGGLWQRHREAIHLRAHHLAHDQPIDEPRRRRVGRDHEPQPPRRSHVRRRDRLSADDGDHAIDHLAEARSGSAKISQSRRRRTVAHLDYRRGQRPASSQPPGPFLRCSLVTRHSSLPLSEGLADAEVDHVAAARSSAGDRLASIELEAESTRTGPIGDL